MASDFRPDAERSILLLSERFAGLAEKLWTHLRARRAEEARASPISVSPIGPGEWAVRWVGEDAIPGSTDGEIRREGWLHPPVSPKRAALRAWETVGFPERGLVVVWDVGLGYALDGLASFLADRGSAARVIVCEEQLDLVWESLNLYNWLPFLADPRIHLFFGPGSDEDLAALLERHRSLLVDGCLMLVGRNLLAAERDRLSRLQERIKHIKETAVCPEPGPPDRNRWVIASGSLAELSGAFSLHAQSMGMTMTVAERPAGLKNFFPSAEAWVETCGGVTPGYHIATYASVFSNRELRSMGQAGTRRIFWFWDRPSFLDTSKQHLENYDLLLVCESSHAEELTQLGYTSVKVLHAATGFSHWDPSATPVPEGLGAPEVAYVGHTGYRKSLPYLARHPKEGEVLLREIRSILENWPAGDPRTLQAKLTALARERAGAWGGEGLYLTFQLSIAEVRKMFLTAALPFGLVVYGDALWGDPRHAGPLPQAYAGRSLDYPTETPHLYHRAKINLNIVNTALLDTVAFRVFDVLACGGFLLTEYRPIFEELFEPGVHLDLFRSPEELAEKIKYYLAHDDLREEIAQAGRQKVLEEHTWASRLARIVEWLDA